jgi:TonB family protein
MAQSDDGVGIVEPWSALTLVTCLIVTCLAIVRLGFGVHCVGHMVIIHSSKRICIRMGAMSALCLMLLALCSGVATLLHAQQTDNGRKLLRRVEPKYPEDLKRHDIGGVVRLSIEVTPQGTVRKISPIGGNPILLEAAMAAVKQWKYTPAESIQTLEVKIGFIPRE